MAQAVYDKWAAAAKQSNAASAAAAKPAKEESGSAITLASAKGSSTADLDTRDKKRVKQGQPTVASAQGAWRESGCGCVKTWKRCKNRAGRASWVSCNCILSALSNAAVERASCCRLDSAGNSAKRTILSNEPEFQCHNV